MSSIAVNEKAQFHIFEVVIAYLISLDSSGKIYILEGILIRPCSLLPFWWSWLLLTSASLYSWILGGVTCLSWKTVGLNKV